jgi:DNA transformation protein
MKNMGPKSSEWLASVGIHTLDDVAQLGVVETYKRVKAAYPDKVSLNMLWGLQAALLDLPWSDPHRHYVTPPPNPPSNLG